MILRSSFLFFGIFVFLFFDFLANTGKFPSDDGVYLDLAIQVKEGNYELTQSPKNHRLGLILPVVPVLSGVENSPVLASWFPMLCGALTLFLLFILFKNQSRSGEIIPWIFIPAFLPLFFLYGGNLFPDVPLAFYLFFLFFLSLSPRVNEFPLRFGIYSGALFVLAFLTKELALIILPWYLFRWFKSEPGSQKKFFGLSLLFISIGFILTELVFSFFSGTPGFLLSSVESEHNFFYKISRPGQFFSRILIQPFQMIFDSYSLLLVFVPWTFLAIPNAFKKENRSELLRNSVVFTLFLLAFLWIGSTSVFSYSPVPLLERMWIVLIPPMVLGIGISLADRNDISQLRKLLVLIFWIGLALVNLMLGEINKGAFYGLAGGCWAAYFFAPLPSFFPTYIRPAFFLLPFVVLSVYFLRTNYF
jgi:hypothetical protein